MTKRYQGSDDWLSERRGGIGSSDVPVLVEGDERRWNELFLEKLGILPAWEGNETMEWGKRLEDVIATAYTERTGEPLLRVDRVLRHPEHDFMRASLDRRRKRGKVIVEIKKVGYRTEEYGPEGSDQVPERFHYQVTHQMIVAGYDSADVAVLFAGSELRVYRLGLDQAIADELTTLVTAAWEYIARGEVPPWPGPPPERPQLKADEVEADDELVELVYHHDVAQLRSDAAEAELTDVKDQLRQRLVEVGGTRGELPDGRRFSVAHRPNRDGQQVAWESIAAGYRRKLIELGVPEEQLDFVSNALTVTKPGARPLRVTVSKPKKEKAAA